MNEKTLKGKRVIQILVLTIAITLGMPSRSDGRQHPDTRSREKIINTFTSWKMQQIRKGNYAQANKCNPSSIRESMQRGHGKDIAMIGFSKESLSFADINKDGRVDALALFKPKQCDGGNALMNSQSVLLVLSGEGNSPYTVDSETLSNLQGIPNGWWLIFNAAEDNGKITGSAMGYSATDARCCPSQSVEFSYEYPSKEILLRREKSKTSSQHPTHKGL